MDNDKKETDAELVLHESAKFLLKRPEMWLFTSVPNWPKLEMKLISPLIARVMGAGMMLYALCYF